MRKSMSFLKRTLTLILSAAMVITAAPQYVSADLLEDELLSDELYESPAAEDEFSAPVIADEMLSEQVTLNEDVSEPVTREEDLLTEGVTEEPVFGNDSASGDSSYYLPYTIEIVNKNGFSADLSRIVTLEEVKAAGGMPEGRGNVINVNGKLHIANVSPMCDYELWVPLVGPIDADEYNISATIGYDKKKAEPHYMASFNGRKGSIAFRYFTNTFTPEELNSALSSMKITLTKGPRSSDEPEYSDDNKVGIYIDYSGKTNVEWEGPIGSHKCMINLYRKDSEDEESELISGCSFTFVNSESTGWRNCIQDSESSWTAPWSATLIPQKEGIYYATLRVSDEGFATTELDGHLYRSPDFEYETPSDQLKATWFLGLKTDEDTGARYLSWNPVDDNGGYELYFYNERDRKKDVLVYLDSNCDSYCIDNQYTYLGAGRWRFRITPLSSNLYEVMPGNAVEQPITIPKINIKLTLSQTSVDLRTDETAGVYLTADLTPNLYGIRFTSSNEKVVSVDDNEDGTATITPVAAGKATITATTTDGSGINAKCQVTVKNGAESVEITASKNQDTLAVGKTLKLTANTTPKNAVNKEVKWSSSNTAIAIVDERGIVTALAPGEATITAVNTSRDDITASYKIGTYIPMTDLKLNMTSFDLHAGGIYAIEPIVTPANATYKKGLVSDNITYAVTAGSEFLQVDENGVVTAMEGLGGKPSRSATVTVTATSDGNVVKTATCKIKITRDAVGVKSVKLGYNSLNMGTGARILLTGTVLPQTADEQGLVWEVDKDSVVSIEETEGGIIVKGLAAGKAKITAKSKENNKKTATCNVTVGQPVDKVVINSKVERLVVGRTANLRATLTDSIGKRAASTSVKWTSSDETVATVSEKGQVKALRAGSVTIRATAETPIEGEAKYDEFTLVTYVPVNKFLVDKTNIKMPAGDSACVSLKYLVPENATDKRIVWKCDKTGIVRLANRTKFLDASEDEQLDLLSDSVVTDEGDMLMIKGEGPGVVKITGITNDGSNKKVTINVNITK